MTPPAISSLFRRLRDSAEGTLLLFSSLLAATILVFTALSWAGFQNARQTADRVVVNLAETASSNLLDMLQRAESNLWGFTHLLRPEDLAVSAPTEQRQRDINATLADHLVGFPKVSSYRIFDAEGRVVFAAGAGKTDFTVGDRAWFQGLRDDPNQRLVLSEPLVGKGVLVPTVVMAVPIRDDEGHFLGAANALVNFTYLEQLLTPLKLGPHGVVTIRRSDNGHLMLRLPANEQDSQDAAQQNLAEAIRNGPPGGSGDLVSMVDQLRRHYAFRAVPGYPLTVIVAEANTDYLHAWRTQTLLLGVVEAGLLLLLSALFYWQRRSREHLAVANQALRQGTRMLRDSEERFRATFEQAAAGLIHVTFDGHLLRFNKRFCDIIGYSPPQVESLCWADICHPEDLAASTASSLHLREGGGIAWSAKHG